MLHVIYCGQYMGKNYGTMWNMKLFENVGSDGRLASLLERLCEEWKPIALPPGSVY